MHGACRPPRAGCCRDRRWGQRPSCAAAATAALPAVSHWVRQGSARAAGLGHGLGVASGVGDHSLLSRAWPGAARHRRPRCAASRLRIRMAGLLAPVAVGLLCRLGDGSGQRLASRTAASGSRPAATAAPRSSSKAAASVRVGAPSRQVQCAARCLGRGLVADIQRPPVDAWPNFSCRKRPCTIRASASTLTTASKILSIVALSRSS